MKIYDSINKDRRQDEGNTIAHINIYKSLLMYANKTVFSEKYNELCNYVLQHKTSMNISIQVFFVPLNQKLDRCCREFTNLGKIQPR
jgi:hypothetical protein